MVTLRSIDVLATLGNRDPEIILPPEAQQFGPSAGNGRTHLPSGSVFKAWPDVAISIKEALIES
jgi:hypothetical protein